MNSSGTKTKIKKAEFLQRNPSQASFQSSNEEIHAILVVNMNSPGSCQVEANPFTSLTQQRY